MYNAILSISGEDLKPPTAIKSFNLTGPLSAGSLALLLNPDASVYSRLVYKYQLVGTEERYLMHVFIAQIGVTLTHDVLRAFLRPLGLPQSSANAETHHIGVELVSEESGRLF